ncbi:MAG: PQQ-binding-like beta-propeller repeat protein [Bryobacterales bacterium]|nr:PQQ-binding-like beta-propeller repeat protein [Bryobacterales bacterium]
MRTWIVTIALLAAFGCSSAGIESPVAASWPQAAGTEGTWAEQSDTAPPTEWSVVRDENIVWRATLPNAGQSGIAGTEEKLFLTTFAPGAGDERHYSADIQGHCVDAETGKLLWSVDLPGSVKSPMMYAYSDSTSPTPVISDNLVVFTNSSGVMAAFDFDGKELWRRTWTPWGAPYPFNKQHEPILYQNQVLNVEPLDGNPEDKLGWNYLRGIDIHTGKTLWIAEDATTTYTTSTFGLTADGEPAVLTGRGGHHDVPERPVGISLISLAPGKEGKTIWRWTIDSDAEGQPLAEPGTPQTPTWQNLWVQHWSPQYAYWWRLNPVESHLVFDSKNGKLLREQSLIHNVDYRPWNPEKKTHDLLAGVNLREVHDWSPRVDQQPDEVIRVQPMWHANIAAGGYHYFFAGTAHRRNRYEPKGKAGPSHCIGRVNIETGKVEYFELPVTVLREPGKPDEFVYGVEVKTKTLNSNGEDVAAEERSRNDGWQIPAFWGSPVVLNGKLYQTTMLGVTYVIDVNAPVLDESALVAVNDLGPSGETWSLNSISMVGGAIYHRTSKELFKIDEKR